MLPRVGIRSISPNARPGVGQRGRDAARRLAGGAGLAGLLVSCDRAPAQAIMGSFFPSWMVCGALGIIVAILVRLVFIWIGVHRHIFAPLLCYPAVAASAALVIWLVCFAG